MHVDDFVNMENKGDTVMSQVSFHLIFLYFYLPVYHILYVYYFVSNLPNCCHQLKMMWMTSFIYTSKFYFSNVFEF